MVLPKPLDSCSKIFMLHMNFRSRAEQHGDWPDYPNYHLKPPSTLTAGNVPIVMPPGVRTMLGEGEIAVVIGKVTRNVSESEALDYVSHVAAANDVTVFDYSWSDAPSLVRSKGFDSFTPIGELVPIDSVDPTNLTLRLWVNGQLRQEAHSSDLIFSIGRLVAELSSIMTLNPGDLLLTGTPAGAPLLAVGDEVVVELGEVSCTANSVVADPRDRNPLIPEPRVSPRGRGLSVGSACHRLSTATTAELGRLIAAGVDVVSKAADENGVPAQPLALTGTPSTFIGHAFTLRQVPARTSGDTWPASATATFNALRAVGPGELLVAEGSVSHDNSSELMRRIAEGSATGLVTEAPPTRYSTYVPVAVNTPVVVNGTTVNPGDIVMSVEGRTLLIAGGTAEKILEVLP
ncbi:fumarylacetoacetate hydrolase family protein [Rhodococcus erythropolis]|uniref:fumarylacetoacetate hydrolase family protein n=1 Tax=Rhodococcus erythropolis TaxID=1833 RepID=UPI000697EAAC|nr:fumarylacetoacetate hydrolase family protein [Rhodococcus erythropolis]